MDNLLSYFSREAKLAILIAVIGPLVYWLLHRKKSADEAGKETTIKIDIAGVEELRKRVEKLEQEQGKSLPKEKKKEGESCFADGVKELEVGKKLLQYGKKAQAESHLEEAIKFFICAADALPCYETFYNLAFAYYEYCDYENAAENYRQAIRHDPSQPGGYNGLGIIYYHTGDYPKAGEYYRQTLAAAEKLDNRRKRLVWQANALGNLGLICRDTGQMEQALAHHQQDLKIQREIGNKPGEANSLGHLGCVYRHLDQMEQALKHHQQALKIHREVGNKLGQAQDLNNLGTVYCQTDQMEQALEHHQQALKIYREIGDRRGKAIALGNLGLVYRNTSQMEEALEHQEQALKIHREIGNKLSEASALNNLGDVYFHTGRMEQAREHFLLARAIYQKIGAGHLVKQVGENLAKLPGG